MFALLAVPILGVRGQLCNHQNHAQERKSGASLRVALNPKTQPPRYSLQRQVKDLTVSSLNLHNFNFLLCRACRVRASTCMYLEWPGRDITTPLIGYISITYESEESLKELITRCTHNFGNGGTFYYYRISSNRMRY